jgi:hypothetical protein
MRAILVGAVVLCGCGSAGESCPRLDGVYLTEYREISGDCGTLPADLATYDRDDPAPERPAGCVVRHQDESEDGCELEIDVECPEDFTDGTRGTVQRTASIHRDAQGATGTLELRLEAADGSRICRSVYDVEVTRR